MKKVLICDSSLKTITAGGTNVLSFKEKLEIAKRLGELNVDVIELDLPRTGKADEILIKTVCNCVAKSAVSCVAGDNSEQVEANYALISGAKHPRLNVVIPVSPIRMEYNFGKKPAAVLELLKTLTAKAASLCGDVEVSLEDATRAEPDFLYQAVRAAVAAGAKTVSVSDIAGTMLPDEFAAFVKGVIDNVPEISGVNFVVGASDVLAMGTANAMSAIAAGANGVKVSSVKTESLPFIENLSAAIENIGIKRGYDTGLNKTAIKRIISSIAELATVKSDGAAASVSEEKAESLSKDLTLAALSKIIKKRGYDLTAEDLKKVYGEFIRLSDKKLKNSTR